MSFKQLIGKSIRLRLVEEHDAAYILQLRLDERNARYLSAVTPDLQAQVDWIRTYKKDEAAGHQFYYVIERMDNGTPCGTMRIYDINKRSFKIGSWIVDDNKTVSAAAESGYLLYRLGFETLGCEICDIDVRKENRQAMAVHRHLGAKRVGEDEVNYYLEFNGDQFRQLQKRVERQLL